MFDFISTQVLNLLATRQPGGLGSSFPDTKRLLPPEIPTAPVARGATAEDQVLLGGTPYAPLPPVPLKPNEPVAPENRVRDVLRKLRERPRNPGPIPDPLPEAFPAETQNDCVLGKRLDLYA